MPSLSTRPSGTRAVQAALNREGATERMFGLRTRIWRTADMSINMRIIFYNKRTKDEQSLLHFADRMGALLRESAILALQAREVDVLLSGNAGGLMSPIGQTIIAFRRSETSERPVETVIFANIRDAISAQ